MTKTVKLSEKEALIIASTQKQQAELNATLQIVREKEALVIELIMEKEGIKSQEVQSLKTENGTLIFELKEAKKKEKVKKPEVVEKA